MPTIASVLYLTDPDDLADVLEDQPSYRADQMQAWLYDTPVLTTDAMTNLPAPLRSELSSELWPFRVETEQTADGGATVKWLFRTPDGMAIESVLMGYAGRMTLCISSQAGCALACSFCATGQFGFDRHLEAGEIYAQVAYARAYVRSSPLPIGPDRVTNIVYMGMGEPLANYERVRESLRRIIDVGGMGARSVTVSTVGMVPGMRRLAEEPWQVRLAVSFHAADDELRSQLVPLNRRYPLAEVEAAARAYFETKGRRVSIEWTLIDEVNDTIDQARKLAPIADRLQAHVNVIALNPTPLSLQRPSRPERIERFMAELHRLGVNCTLRDTRGQDIDAACGQLRARSEPVEIAGSKASRPIADGPMQPGEG